MGTAISWVFEAAIKPDGVDDYRALAREIVADNAANEPGQTVLEWFIDAHDLHIYERYADSAAALTSSDSWRTSSSAFSACAPRPG